MKPTSLSIHKILLSGLLIYLATQASAFTTVWIATASTDWNDFTAWSAGVPGSGDVAIFDGTGNGACLLTASATIDALQITGYIGLLDLGGNTLTINGTTADSQFLSGIIFGANPSLLSIGGTNGATFAGSLIQTDLLVDISTTSGVFTGSSSFSGTVDVTAYSIILSSGSYSGTTTFTKIGTSTDAGVGGNLFSGTTTIINQANGNLRLGTTASDVFDGELHLSLEGSGSGNKIQIAYASAGNRLNNNIKIQSNNTDKTNGEISFGASGGTSVLASGMTIEEDVGEFLKGDFWMNNISQSGTTPQALNLQIVVSSASKLRFKISGCTFNGNVDFAASNLYVSTSTFNGITNVFTKTLGGGNDTSFPPPAPENTWDGGNTFNDAAMGGTTTINNMHNSTLVLGNSAGDVFNGDATFYADQATSGFRISEGALTQFKGNLSFTVDASLASLVQFGANGGSTILDGSSTQTITTDNLGSASNNPVPRFMTSLTIDNPAGVVLNRQITLATSLLHPSDPPVAASSNLDMQSGNIIASTLNYVLFEDNSTTTGASDASFIEGPAHKIGDDAFIFPLGGNSSYHPLSISAPASATSEFVAEYFASGSGLGTTADVGIATVSTCEFWTLNQPIGADNLFVGLSWVNPMCTSSNYITDISALQVMRWNGTLWNSLGNGGTTGSIAAGTVTAAISTAAFGTFTLGSTLAANTLPVELAFFDGSEESSFVNLHWATSSELNNDHFLIERSHDAILFETVAEVQGQGTTNEFHSYTFTDQNPYKGWNFYRLHQVDFDGTDAHSDVIQVWVDKAETTIYPNPVVSSLYTDRLNQDDGSVITITNLTGKIMYQAPAGKVLDVTGLPPGLYVLTTLVNGTPKTFRFQKK